MERFGGQGSLHAQVIMVGLSAGNLLSANSLSVASLLALSISSLTKFLGELYT